MKGIDVQAQEIQKIPNKMNPKRFSARYIIIKMPKIKEKETILKTAKENQFITYEEASVMLMADFSTETFWNRRDRHENFKVMKSKALQPRLLYPAKLPFRIKVEIKSFTARKS